MGGRATGQRAKHGRAAYTVEQNKPKRPEMAVRAGRRQCVEYIKQKGEKQNDKNGIDEKI